ncbi:MAG: histidine phosphatase family protein [Candidatus Dormibacteria bacterium]
MAVYLIRHGETEWSRTHRHTGRTDLPLTAEGEGQGIRLGQRLAGLEFDRVLTSPRLRARRTAELAGFPAAEVSPLLAEFDYGDYEGLSRAEIERARPGWDLWRHGCPGGESPAQVEARARKALAELGSSTERNYLLVTHGHMLRALAAVYLGSSLELCDHLIVAVASISVLAREHGLTAIAAWNLTWE